MKAMAQSLNFEKSVSDNGWGMFVTFLRYKLDEQGKKLVKGVQAFKPVMFVVTKIVKRLSVREWDCPECGIHHDRDVNVTINIKNEGMRLAHVYPLHRTVGHTGIARLCLAQ
ncbi:MAG: transposase [Allobaculum sp.]|nr:transposase [Allobaculum sp.]